MVTLRPIEAHNRAQCCALAVHKEQEKFVLRNEEALREAAQYPELHPMGIYQEEQMVGFLLYSQEKGRIGLWRLMIDAASQRRGFAREALTMFLLGVQISDPAATVFTTVAGDNYAAQALYRSFDFAPSGKLVQGEEEWVRG